MYFMYAMMNEKKTSKHTLCKKANKTLLILLCHVRTLNCRNTSQLKYISCFPQFVINGNNLTFWTYTVSTCCNCLLSILSIPLLWSDRHVLIIRTYTWEWGERKPRCSQTKGEDEVHNVNNIAVIITIHH